MVCSKCGQELKEGAKFCTKCGTRFSETINLMPNNLVLPIVSIIISVIGIIGYLVIRFIMKSDFMPIYYLFQNIFFVLEPIGIVIALIALNKQKSLISFIAGLIPCAFLIIVEVYYIILNLKNYRFF